MDAIGLTVEECFHTAEHVHLVLERGHGLQFDAQLIDLARLVRLPPAGIETQAPEPCAEADRQFLTVGESDPVGVEEAVEEGQADRDCGTTEHAAQYAATIHLLHRDHC